MCEFCTAHGEGQKWYLEMKNYAEEASCSSRISADKNVGTLSLRRGGRCGLQVRRSSPQGLELRS